MIPITSLSLERAGVWSGSCSVQGWNAEGAGEAMNHDPMTAANSSCQLAIAENGLDVDFTWTVTNNSGETVPYLLFRIGDSVGEKTPLAGLVPFGNFVALEAGHRMTLGWPDAMFPFALWKTPAATCCLYFKEAHMTPVLFTQNGDGGLYCVVRVDLPTGVTRVCTLSLRLAAHDAILETALGSFKSYWLDNAPAQEYVKDARPVVHWIRANRSSVTMDNPYGFVDWRPDQNLDVARAWAHQQATAAIANGFQAVIAHGGDLGFAFSAFDAAFWGQSIDGAELDAQAFMFYKLAFAEPWEGAGLAVGCVQRPGILQTMDDNGQVARRKATGSDDDAAMMAARFQRAGLAFYLDSGMMEGGASVQEAVDVLRRLRAKMGEHVGIWLESTGHHLLFAPYVGAYADLRNSPEAQRDLPFNVQLLLAIYPEMGVIANDAHADDMQEYRAWCDERGLSAYVHDYRVAEATP